METYNSSTEIHAIPPHTHHPRTLLRHYHRHREMTLSPTTVLLIVIPIVIIILLIAISLLLLMLRRLQQQTAAGGEGCRNEPSSRVVNNSNCLFISHCTINIKSSPETKGGCLYGSNSNMGREPPHGAKAAVKATTRGVQVLRYKELEEATEGFKESNVIGNGGYGVVYRGVLSDETVVAVKVLHRQGKLWERAFRLEVDILSRLDYPYLVQLLGYCADQQHRLLIFEYMPNGSLQQHLHRSTARAGATAELNWGARLRIALDCARGLEYLHEHTAPSVIHRDFNCSNVLLDHNYRAKVSDFGLAKIGSDKINGQISTRVLGTTGYLAPEYASTGKLTTKSDVYSYGVVLLELLTGRVPIDTRRPPGEHVLVSWALPRLTNREKVVEMVDPALKGQYSLKELIQVAAIAAMCVQTEADYRPLMTDVVQSLIPLIKTQSSSCPPSFRYNNNNNINNQTTNHNMPL